MMNWSLQTPPSDPAANDGAGRVAINTPTRDALLGDLDDRLADGRGFTVATLNLDHVVKLRSDAAFHDAYARHTHVVADGNPIVWLSRVSGRDIQLVPGSELVEPLCCLAARREAPVALMGSTPEALRRAGDELVRRYPSLKIVARISPPMGFEAEGAQADAAIEEIRESGARLCFLALGAPRQEVFSVRAHERLPQTGFLSIGAGLDFIAGHQKRAPAFARVLAAEWLWRLASNPRRLGLRYAKCIAVLPSLTGAALRARKYKT